MIDIHLQRHSAYAFGAALLFGASAPVSKWLLERGVGVLWLAGLLYLGSGVGLLLVQALRQRRRPGGAPSAESPLRGRDWWWLAGAIAFGGVVAPALLFWGLSGTSASEASLLLATEGVLTVLISAAAFGEQVDRRVWLGAALMLVASGLLSAGSGWASASASGSGSTSSWSWSASSLNSHIGGSWHALAIVAACACWGVDNNLTRPIAGADPVMIAMTKGLAAGAASLGLACWLGGPAPGAGVAAAAMALGSLAYGISLLLYILALRHLGSARAAAHFGTAPFIGALLSILLLGETPSPTLLAACALMALATWIALSERHAHEHSHPVGMHAHRHVHDDPHHQHLHDGTEGPEPHAHAHRHEALAHSHPHLPDLHHRHRHQVEPADPEQTGHG